MPFIPTIDESLASVSDAVQGPVNPYSFDMGLDPTMDPWKSPTFVGGSGSFPAGPGAARASGTGKKPPGNFFYLGDDSADLMARVKNVDPSTTTDWVALAKTQLGSPYTWGASDPSTGFDCSGFTQWLVKRVTGVQLPGQSTAQADATQKVAKDQLQRGDLLFFSYGRLGPGVVSHVEVYLGNGKSIGTSNPTEDLDIDPVDWEHFVQGGRVPGMGAATVPQTGQTKPKRGRRPPAPAGEQPLTVPFASGSAYFTGAVLPLMEANPRTPDRPIRAPVSGQDLSRTQTVALAKRMAAQKGWTGQQWKDLYSLWERESGWQSGAVNPSSGATGIPQLLPESHDVPNNWDDPVVQLQWGMKYIAQRYGDPSSAWAHSNAEGWY